MKINLKTFFINIYFDNHFPKKIDNKIWFYFTLIPTLIIAKNNKTEIAFNFLFWQIALEITKYKEMRYDK